MSNGQVTLAPAAGRPMHRVEPSHRINCDSGSEIASRTGSTGDMHFGHPAVADGRVQIILDARIQNPLAPAVVSPTIDYSVDFLWDVASRALRVKATVGKFPAFEAYAQLNDGEVLTLFRQLPEDGSTVWSLYDFGLGGNVRSFEANASLKDSVVEKPKRVLLNNDVKRHLYVSHGLYTARTKSPDPILYLGIATSARQAGLPRDKIEGLLQSLRDVLSAQEKQLRSAHLDIGRDPVEVMKFKLQACLRDPQVNVLPIASEFRRAITRFSQPLENLAQSKPKPPTDSDDDPFSAYSSLLTGLLESSYKPFDEDSTLRAIYENQFKPLLLVDPGDNLEQIKEKDPQFADEPLVRPILSMLQGGQDKTGDFTVDLSTKAAVMQTFETTIDQVGNSINQNLQAIATDELARDPIGASLRIAASKTQIDAARLRAGVQAVRDGITLGNADAAVYLLQTGANLFDQKLASDIGTVGRGAIQIAQAVSAWRQTSDLGGMAFGIGASAATMNYIGLAMSLTQLFGSGGAQGNADPQILAAVKQISDQIESLRQEMQDRFDRVDMRLESIYDEMHNSFAQMRDALSQVHADLSMIEDHILQIQARMNTSESRLLTAIDNVRSEMTAEHLAACINWKDVSATVPMPAETYVNCLSLLRTISKRAPATPSDFPSNTELIATLTMGERDYSIDRAPMLINLATQLGVHLPSAGVDTKIPSPMDWIASAQNYLAMAHQWPGLDRRQTNLKYIGDLLSRGKRLQHLISELAIGKSSEAVFQELIGRYSSTLDSVELHVKEARTRLTSKEPTQDEQALIQQVVSEDLSEDLGPLTVSLGSRSFPVEWFEAFRVGRKDLAARYRVMDYLGKASGGNGYPISSVEPDPNGYLQITVALFVGDNRIFEGAYNSPHDTIPQAYTCGGIAGCANPYLKQVFTRQWPNIKHEIETGVAIPGIDPLPDAPPYYNAKAGLAAVKKSLEAPSNNWVYKDVLAKNAPSLQELEARKLLLRNFAELSFSSELNHNDALSAVLRGSVQIVGSDNLKAPKTADMAPEVLLKAARERLSLFHELIVGTSAARAGNPGLTADPLLDETVRELGEYYTDQQALCAAHEKPEKTCDLHVPVQ